MTEIDNKFFEEYKRLNKLCCDLLNSQNGVTDYISDMEHEANASRLVPTWTQDYYTLKDLRHIRNQIAHDTDGYQYATAEDLNKLQAFHRRILNQQDPFSLLYQARKATKNLPKKTQHPTNPQSSHQVSIYESNSQKNYPTSSQKQSPVFALIRVLLVILILVYGISPMDLISDVIPILGYLDDIAVAVFGILGILNIGRKGKR